MVSNKLGRLMRKKRQELGISQARLGSLMGYTSGQYISNWERGVANPSLIRSKKLIQVLKLDKEKFIAALTSNYKENLKRVL